MSLYYRPDRPDEPPREIADEVYQAWLTAGNPKATAWQPYTPPEPEAVEPHVPEEVSNQQLRLALIDAGIFPSAILAQLQAMPDGADKEKALAAWEYANHFRREHPLVSALAHKLGLSSTQVDGLFVAASTLG